MAMFEIGDKVHWTKQSRRGKTVSFQRKDGQIVAVNGDVADIRLKSGKITKGVPLDGLRLAGEKSTLTELVETIVEANRDKRTCVL